LIELALGHSVNQVLDVLFDYLMYPAMIAWLGLWRGGLIMATVSLAVCLIMLWLYDLSKRDWLGIEVIRSAKSYDGPSRLRRLISWILRRGDVAACLFLSIRYDPFITILYLRHESFAGMNRRDWIIFFTSWFIGNSYWALACFTGVESLTWLWQWYVASSCMN
jgi:hypothetical protein